MSKLAWLAGRLSDKRIGRETTRHLEKLTREPSRASETVAREMLRKLLDEPDPKVELGKTTWGEPVVVPLAELVNACGIATGGMGSGKTMGACVLLDAMIERMPQLRSMSFGVLDAKGELFERALFLLARRLDGLQGSARQELLDRIVVIDFSSRQAVSPYNILSRWPYTERDFFVTSRLETLRELLPSGDKLSLRGATVLKNALALLSEFDLPLTYLTHLLDSQTLRAKLLSRTKNPELRSYFGKHFAKEGQQTIGALRARMESLVASDGVRLALSGSTAPDFRQLQNEGKIVLVNCAGPSITRGVRLLLQGLVLSDIRQAIFSRPNNPPVSYLWLADEAQNFFLTRQQQENMADVLTMARSFGSFFLFLCQNLTCAIPDSRILEILHTNIRWSLTLRGTPADARFLRSALPVTGRRPRPEPHPYRERTNHSRDEERALLLEEIANLPDRTGYLWLKTRSPEAVRIETSTVHLPDSLEFRRMVEASRSEATLGGRIRRDEYEEGIRKRDGEWLEPADAASSDLSGALETRYREERPAWQ
jgi:hypothetical protein